MRVLTGAGIRSLTSRPPSLEELFLAHYRADVPAGVPMTAVLAGGGPRYRAGR